MVAPMDENAPKPEVTEFVKDPVIKTVCPDANCPTCFMVGRMLEAFEASVFVLEREMGREKKNLQKIDLIAVTTFDLGAAFARLMDRTSVDEFAVPNARERFMLAAEAVERGKAKIREYVMLAGIGKIGKMN